MEDSDEESPPPAKRGKKVLCHAMLHPRVQSVALRHDLSCQCWDHLTSLIQPVTSPNDPCCVSWSNHKQCQINLIAVVLHDVKPQESQGARLNMPQW